MEIISHGIIVSMGPATLPDNSSTSAGKRNIIKFKLVVQMCNILKGRNIIFSRNCTLYLYSRYNSHQLISIHTLRYREREGKKRGGGSRERVRVDN